MDWAEIKDCPLYRHYGSRECAECKWKKECWESQPHDDGDKLRKEVMRA